MRQLSYANAINEALHQMLDSDDRVFLIGQGVTSPWYVGMTTRGLIQDFGPEKVIDTPVSENGISGVAVGAALAGMRPVLMHPRMDFMYYAMDQIANHAANWYFMFGGQLSVPLTIWGIINRGGEQAAQHSQALNAIFAHLPGVKVVAPSTPRDAKGLLISCIKDENPVVYVDDRWLYDYVGDVPEGIFTTPIGKGDIRRKGRDITVVAASYSVIEAIRASEILANEGIDLEIIDLRSIKPIDKDLIFDSIKNTGRLMVVDGAWKTCGLSAEISAMVAESRYFNKLKSPIFRIALPDTPAPCSRNLERMYYCMMDRIIETAREIMKPLNNL